MTNVDKKMLSTTSEKVKVRIELAPKSVVQTSCEIFPLAGNRFIIK